jgi:hypothetical protein
MYGVRFLQTHLCLFYERAQLAPYELSPGITRRLCGWLGASGTEAARKFLRALSSEALAELPARGSQAAVAHTRAMALHGCCARVSLAAALLSQLNILTAWPGRGQGR